MIRQPEKAAAIFDPQRLRLARSLRGLKKKELAALVGVTAAAISQYELGQARPRPAVLSRLALALRLPAGFFAAGRPIGALGAAGAHFRSLRATTVRDRTRAVALVGVLWELSQVIERYVELPSFDPFIDQPQVVPEAAARALRRAWGLPKGPVANLVRLMESRGILVFQDSEVTEKISAFSAPVPPRPIVVLDRRHDRARARFDAAHELGHLLLHPDPDPGTHNEEEANNFAAEFLMPADEIEPQLPRAASLRQYGLLKTHWGVSIQALFMRARQLGVLSDNSYRRGMQKLVSQYGRLEEPLPLGPAEEPVLLPQAVRLLEENGIGVDRLANELCLPEDMVRQYVDTGLMARRPSVWPQGVLAGFPMSEAVPRESGQLP